jgi:hypothetical protein
MTASLARKVSDLETAFWSKVEYIQMPVSDEAEEFMRAVYPLESCLFHSWFEEDSEAQKIHAQMERIEKRLPPIHPAFLPASEEIVRLHQWGLQKRADYRKLVERFWARYSEYVLSRFRGDRLAVALQLFEKDFDRHEAEYQYLEQPPQSREEYAKERIDFRLRLERARFRDQMSHEERWRKVALEQVRDLYGRKMTEEELEFDIKQWSQLREDMAAGKRVSESEAARYLRDLIERYPRKDGVKRS